MNMPLDNPAAVYCANGHSRRFTQFHDGSMRRLHQQEPGDFSESSPWMPDETGTTRANGVYCALCDTMADFSDHTDVFLDLMSRETSDWSEVPFRVCDGLTLMDSFPVVHSNMFSHLENLRRHDFAGHIKFSLDCSSEAWEEVGDDCPMQFSEERAKDVITSMAFLMMELACTLDDEAWAIFLRERREGVAETALDCELVEWDDISGIFNQVMDILEGPEPEDLDVDCCGIDDPDSGEEAA
jgi:hypothetical protein